jgi:predicted PilT family ATPase
VSRRRSISPRQRLNFDFKIFIKEKYSQEFSFSNLERIVNMSKVEDIYADDSVTVPDLPGKVLVIKGQGLEERTEALSSILRKLNDSEILIFIPEALVSMVIGKKGGTINRLKQDSGCDIVVN